MLQKAQPKLMRKSSLHEMRKCSASVSWLVEKKTRGVFAPSPSRVLLLLWWWSLVFFFLAFIGSADAIELSTARFYLASAAAVGSKVLFAGGAFNGSTIYNVVDIYDSSSGNWTTLFLSRARYALAAVAVASSNNSLVFGGGTESGTYSNAVDIYHANNNTWSTAQLSQPRTELAAVSLGNKVLFGGGRGNDSTNGLIVDILDIDTGNWTTANLSSGRFALAGAAAGSKVLFGGGVTQSDGRASNVVDIYDVISGNWTTSNLSSPRRNLAAAAGIGNKVFFAGGNNGSSASNIVDIYDVDTGNWTIATLSQARSHLAAVIVGNKLLVGGGQSVVSPSVQSSVVDIYDTVTGNWTTAQLSLARAALTASAVQGKAYFAGGFDDAQLPSAVVDVFDCSGATCVLETAPTTTAAAATTPPVTSSSPPVTSTPTATATTTTATTTAPPSTVVTTVAQTTIVSSACFGSPPLVNAICNQGTWVSNGPVALQTPLQLNSSTPLVIQGDLDQRGNEISINVTSVTVIPLTVHGTARLNGTLVLTVTPSRNDTVVPTLQAESIIGLFDTVNVTMNEPSSRCVTGEQRSDGRSLSVLLKSSCRRGGIPVVAIVIPVVIVGLLVVVALLGWYVLRVRRMFPGAADVLWRSKRDMVHTPATEYHRM